MKGNDMILRAAFWSGRFTYRKWRGILYKSPREHMRVFVQSFAHLPLDWLLGEIGEKRFISIWPEARSGFDASSPVEASALNACDAIWGVLSVGDSQYPVSVDVAGLPAKRREALKAVVCNPGISIYDLAKQLRREYSRVYKDVRLLEKMGEVEAIKDPRSSRRVTRLIPTRSVNSTLSGARSFGSLQ